MTDYLLEPLNHLLRASDRIYLVYLFSAMVIAFALYTRRIHDSNSSLGGFFRYCFPKRIWGHPSTFLDIRFFVVNRILFLVVFMPLVLLVFPFINQTVQAFWSSVLSPPNWQASTAVFVLYGALVLVGLDFIRFITHYLQHKIPLLWNFHRLHHSAEVLTPLTVYRMHPVDDLFPLALASVYLALLHGTFSALFVNDFSFATFGLTSLVSILFYLLGYNLRHSHVWLSYGTKVSRWLISPAQHQIHHSSLPQHRDKNMGFMFAIWDRAFGTLYVPENEESLVLGVDDAGTGTTFRSVARCYIEPFRKAFSSKRIATAGLVLAVGATASASVVMTLPGIDDSQELALNNLTSPEVKQLIEQGYRTVVVPTGGLEYNGAHLTLGKHQSVVGYAAEKVAAKLGNTLVAPVIAYVPEGDIFPPTGHMVHSGTITVRVSTFEALLEDTARSLFQHGIERVLFMGDSGWNQQPQQVVADRLNSEWPDTSRLTLSLTDYYDQNGQMDWLVAQGFTEPQVGFHAGLRDSSELLFVNAQQVRGDELRKSGQKDNVSGSYWKANAEIGQQMIALKVAAAVNQARDSTK